MTSAERKLLLYFLEELSEHQGAAGCNDFRFPKTFSAEEKAELAAKYTEECRRDEPNTEDQNPDGILMDVILLGMLQRRLENEQRVDEMSR